MLARFIVRAIFAAVGLWLSAVLMHAVAYNSLGSLIAAAVLLGVVNAFVRPVVTLLTLPLSILTLGLFLLVVNAAMSGLVPGIIAAVVTGLTSWIGHMVIGNER